MASLPGQCCYMNIFDNIIFFFGGGIYEMLTFFGHKVMIGTVYSYTTLWHILRKLHNATKTYFSRTGNLVHITSLAVSI